MADETAAAPGAAATTTTTEAAPSLLDKMLDSMTPASDIQRERDKQFIEAVIRSAIEAKPGTVVAGDVDRTITAWQAQIDQKLSAQLNEILHHPEFQKLEGTWRGLQYLVANAVTGKQLKINVLNVSKRTLQKDLEDAVEFDQSSLFKKVYEAGYGQLGGSPYGMLVGDYEFDGKSADDVFVMQQVGGIGAASHCPFVAAAGADMFSLKTITDLNNPRDLGKIFEGIDYASWNSFRKSQDSRYVGLTVPRVIARTPYGRGDSDKKLDAFRYEEKVDGTDHNKYLWMNASWAYAARCCHAFTKDGWFMRTVGEEGGGKVEGLPLHITVQAGGKVAKCPTEVLIPDRREAELAGLGFLPLLHYKDSDNAVFMGSQTSQSPEEFMDPAATSNAALSAKLNYMMCVSRFAHYLKVMARAKIGSFMEQGDMERWLNGWIMNYCTADPVTAGPDIRAKKPLQGAQIAVTEVPGKPGYYQAVAHLRPHFQLQGLGASMRLVAELPKKK